MDHVELSRQTSLLYWFPAVQELEIRHPKTVIIEKSCEMGLRELCKLVDGATPGGWAALIKECQEKGQALGEPVFVRTDYVSDKHSWSETCYCENLKTVGRNLCALIEFTCIVDVGFQCFVLREMLRLKASFKAFRGMPIGREFRYFVEDGKVVHVQPYWPPDAIWRPDCEDWREKLAELSKFVKAEREAFGHVAATIGQKLGGAWSVDVAQTEEGDWYLIDMARAEISFRWPGAWEEDVFVGDSNDTT